MALRRALALVLTLLVVVETGGLARAFAADATVHCCCGDHSAARRCDCKSCPVTLRGHHEAPTGDRLCESHSCGASADQAMLVMLAVPPPAPPALGPDRSATAIELPLHDLSSAIVSAERPPP